MNNINIVEIPMSLDDKLAAIKAEYQNESFSYVTRSILKWCWGGEGAREFILAYKLGEFGEDYKRLEQMCGE